MPKVTIKDGILTLQIPYDKAGTISSTKKTILHASENSKADIDGIGQVSINCNVYTPNPDYVPPKKD